VTWDLFFARFLPVFAATFLGVLLSFVLNRFIEQRQEEKERQEEIGQLNRALDAIVEAIEHNQESLSNIRDVLASGQIIMDPALDYSTWDAVKRDIVQYLHDPELQRQIAFHFSRMEAISNLNDRLVNYSSGVASAVGGSENLRDSLRDYMRGLVSDRIQESEEILTDIERARDNISGNEA
jgi:hypothetical protein